MKEASHWSVSKWPFLCSGIALLMVAGLLAMRPAHAMTSTEIMLATAAVALGAWLACLPYILEYRAATKLVELNALGTVAGHLTDLKQYSARITEATGQWALVQEATRGSAEKTAAAAREIAERMAGELREFNEFQARVNDNEKAALRLEVEKLRRGEGEWLQVLARTLDNIFALHQAAVRSGQQELIEQISAFQNACRDIARRVGLVMFVAGAGEVFDGEKHRAHGVENPPASGIVAETLAPGLSFQGRLVRPVLVRVKFEEQTPAVASSPGNTDSQPPETPGR